MSKMIGYKTQGFSFRCLPSMNQQFKAITGYFQPLTYSTFAVEVVGEIPGQGPIVLLCKISRIARFATSRWPFLTDLKSRVAERVHHSLLFVF